MKLSNIKFGSRGLMVGSYNNPKQKDQSLRGIVENLKTLVDEGRLISLLLVDAGSLYKTCYIEALKLFLKKQGEQKALDILERELLSWGNKELKTIYSLIDKDVLIPKLTIKDKKITENLENDESYIIDFLKLCELFSNNLKEGLNKFDTLYQKDKRFKQHVDSDVETFANKQFVILRREFPQLNLHLKRDQLIPFLEKAALDYLKIETAFREIVINCLEIDYEFYPGDQNATMKYFQWYYYKSDTKNKGKWIVLEGKRPNTGKKIEPNNESTTPRETSKKELILFKIISDVCIFVNKSDEKTVAMFRNDITRTIEQYENNENKKNMTGVVNSCKFNC